MQNALKRHRIQIPTGGLGLRPSSLRVLNGILFVLALTHAALAINKNGERSYSFQFELTPLHNQGRVFFEAQYPTHVIFSDLKYGIGAIPASFLFYIEKGEGYASVNSGLCFFSLAIYIGSEMNGDSFGPFNLFGFGNLPSLFLWPQVLTNWNFRVELFTKNIGLFTGPVTDVIFTKHPFVNSEFRFGTYANIGEIQIHAQTSQRIGEWEQRYSLGIAIQLHN